MQNPPPGPPPGGQPPGYPPQGGQQPGYPPQGGQQPGSYPPPGYQPPGYQPGYQQQPSAAPGIDKKTGAILAYLLWWITGIVFLFVGRSDPDVKFHAAQSTVFFGSISIVGFILNRVASVTDGLGVLLGLISFLIWLFGVVVWIICLVRASGGGGARFELPWVGGIVTPYAEQLANAVN